MTSDEIAKAFTEAGFTPESLASFLAASQKQTAVKSLDDELATFAAAQRKSAEDAIREKSIAINDERAKLTTG